MTTTKVTLPEIMSVFESKTLQEMGDLEIVYYNTSSEKDATKVEQSRFIAKYVKNKQIFDTTVKEHWDEAISQKIITEEMISNFKIFSLCHPLDVITDLEKTLEYFDCDDVRYRLTRYENEYGQPMLYDYDKIYFIKYLFYLMILSVKKDGYYDNKKYYQIPSPKDCIGYYLNYDMLQSEDTALEFMESKEAKIIGDEALKSFIDDINFDDIYEPACCPLISVKFIEDFFNIFGKDISIKTTGEDLNSYLNRDKTDDCYYDEM
jgi:hypothetical protein